MLSHPRFPLEPAFLNDLITDEVTYLRDDGIHEDTMTRQGEFKSVLEELSRMEWDDIKEATGV